MENGIILLGDGIWQDFKVKYNRRKKTSEIYLFAFKLLSIKTRDVHVVYPAPQTITPDAEFLW